MSNARTIRDVDFTVVSTTIIHLKVSQLNTHSIHIYGITYHYSLFCSEIIIFSSTCKLISTLNSHACVCMELF